MPVCAGKSCNGCTYLLNGCTGNKSDAPKKLQVFLHEGQMRVKNSQKQYVAALCGAQSGKTEMMPMIMHDEMLKRGSGDALAVSSSFPLMDKKLVPIYRQYFENYLHIGQWYEAKKKLVVESGDLKYTIFFGSAKNPDSLESATAKVAHLDEAGQDEFTLDGYEAVLRRVSGNNGRIFFTTTLYNFGWLKSQVYDRWMQGDQDYDVIQWDSIIRPGFSKTVWADRKRKMQSWKFDMQLRGIYSRPAGMIYSDFCEEKHLIKPFTIPQKWNWHVGIDPGGVHTALLWIAEEPNVKKYYVVKSYLDGNMTTPQHVAKAKRQHEYPYVIDWRGGNLTNEQQFRDDWNAEGIPVQEPAVRNVEAQIDRVNTLWKDDRLFVFDNEANTTAPQGEMSFLDEVRSYSRELDENGQPTEKIKDDKKYHKLACLRYFASKITTEGDYSTPITFQSHTVPHYASSRGDFMNSLGARAAPPKFR